MTLGKSSQQQTEISRRLLRCKQAANYLGVGAKRIRQLVLSGDLPCVRMDDAPNSPFLIDLRDLDKFVDQHKSQ